MMKRIVMILGSVVFSTSSCELALALTPPLPHPVFRACSLESAWRVLDSFDSSKQKNPSNDYASEVLLHRALRDVHHWISWKPYGQTPLSDLKTTYVERALNELYSLSGISTKESFVSYEDEDYQSSGHAYLRTSITTPRQKITRLSISVPFQCSTKTNEDDELICQWKNEYLSFRLGKIWAGDPQLLAGLWIIQSNE